MSKIFINVNVDINIHNDTIKDNKLKTFLILIPGSIHGK